MLLASSRAPDPWREATSRQKAETVWPRQPDLSSGVLPVIPRRFRLAYPLCQPLWMRQACRVSSDLLCRRG